MKQQEALAILKTGASVFLTGQPGAGKTHTIRAYIAYLREHGIEPAITASTGIAATHIHGMTIHAWSGVGVRQILSEYDLDILGTQEYLVKRITGTKVLIIDEVSMLSGELLAMVDIVCRTLRGSAEPFGGMQVVFVGDFFQLPPVVREHTATFAFASPVWQELGPLVCYLSEQHRQDDPVFLDLLTSMRNGTVTQTHQELLHERMVRASTVTSDTPQLFTHTRDVDALNTQALEGIQGESHAYTMTSAGNKGMVLGLIRGCLSPEVLVLKTGARVMCTKNNPREGYVNGTLGTVTGFSSVDAWPVITTDDGRRITIQPLEWAIEDGGKTKASITQVPLRLAWAITIHKSQGMSMDSAVIDLSQAFAYGQGYVALSRVRTLAGIALLGITEQALLVHPEVAQEDVTFRALAEEASRVFGDIDEESLLRMHHNFIIHSGGSLKKIPTHTKSALLRSRKQSTESVTQALLAEGKSLEEAALSRGLTRRTIAGHVATLVTKGMISQKVAYACIDPKEQQYIKKAEQAFKKIGTEKLLPVFDALDKVCSFETLTIVRATLQ